MADKISTVELEVDLECHRCYKKLKKAVCKCCEIKSQVFDEKQNKVILSGPFNSVMLIHKLCSKVGCEIIKGYKIVIVPPQPSPPPSPLPTPPPGVQVGLTIFCIVCFEVHADGYCKRGGYHRPVCCKECYEGRDDGYCKGVGGPQYYSGCSYFSEEDSACTIM